MEPEALHGGGALADGHFEEGHTAGAQQGRTADFRDDAGGFAWLELGERAGIQPVFVAKGKMEEEIFDGEDGLLGQSPGDSGANALDELDRSFEREHGKTRVYGLRFTG